MTYRLTATFYRRGCAEVRRYDVFVRAARSLSRAAASLLDSERDRCGFDGYRYEARRGQ